MDEDAIEGGGGALPSQRSPVADVGRCPLLLTITIATVTAAVLAGIIAWNTYQQRETNRRITCINYSYNLESGKPIRYEELEPYQQKVVDVLDCDLPGR